MLKCFKKNEIKIELVEESDIIWEMEPYNFYAEAITKKLKMIYSKLLKGNQNKTYVAEEHVIIWETYRTIIIKQSLGEIPEKIILIV